MERLMKLDREYATWILELANRGLSPTTIKYTHYFYRLYCQLLENRQGVIDDLDCIFKIPWSLHILILDKVKNDPHKALFFVKKTLENNWGHSVLLNFISSDLYERQGAAQTNFALTLPAPESDLAQELLKSPDDLKKALPTTEEIEKGLMGV